MAATYARDLAVSFVSQASPVQTWQVNATASVGEKIVGYVSCATDQTLAVTDSAGNTYGVNKTADVANALHVFLFYADVTTQLSSGGTMVFTFSIDLTNLTLTADVLAGAATGTPADFQATTGQLENWSTPNSTTTDGSILYGGSTYRNATVSTSTPINGTERHDSMRGGNYNSVVHSREIATGGTHNISGTWSDVTGLTSTAKHMLIAAGAAGSPPNFPVATRLRFNG